MTKREKLEQTLKALGFEKTCVYNQWESKKYKVCVYTYYNKIESVQLSKVWLGTPTNYDNYLEEVRNLLSQLNDIQ